MEIVLSDGVFADGWDFADGCVTWDGTAIVWQSDVPEPATLVVLGLGLAGLGLARRLNNLVAPTMPAVGNLS